MGECQCEAEEPHSGSIQEWNFSCTGTINTVFARNKEAAKSTYLNKNYVVLYTWEKWSRTVNPYENIIPALSPIGHACLRQLFVSIFYTWTQCSLFPWDCSSQLWFFFCTHLFWAHAHAFFILPEYCGWFLSFQIHRNTLLHTCCKSKYTALRGPFILMGWQMLLPKYNTDQEHFFSLLLSFYMQ